MSVTAGDEMVTFEFDTAQLMGDIRGGSKASLREIAAQTNGAVSASTLSRMDNGTPPDMQTFLSLCGHFRLYPGDYFRRVVWVRAVDKAEPGKRVK